jgi:hypothetical protein
MRARLRRPQEERHALQGARVARIADIPGIFRTFALLHCVVAVTLLARDLRLRSRDVSDAKKCQSDPDIDCPSLGYSQEFCDCVLVSNMVVSR